jgi:hypothetical protein
LCFSFPSNNFPSFFFLPFHFSHSLLLRIFPPCFYCFYFFSFPLFFFFSPSPCSYCYFMNFPPMPFWATKTIWLPSDTRGVSNGDWLPKR